MAPTPSGSGANPNPCQVLARDCRNAAKSPLQIAASDGLRKAQKTVRRRNGRNGDQRAEKDARRNRQATGGKQEHNRAKTLPVSGSRAGQAGNSTRSQHTKRAGQVWRRPPASEQLQSTLAVTESLTTDLSRLFGPSSSHATPPFPTKADSSTPGRSGGSSACATFSRAASSDGCRESDFTAMDTKPLARGRRRDQPAPVLQLREARRSHPGRISPSAP